jgi:hypothetical protein
VTLTKFFQYVRRRKAYKPGNNSELKRDNTEFARRVRLNYVMWCAGLHKVLREQIERDKKERGLGE